MTVPMPGQPWWQVPTGPYWWQLPHRPWEQPADVYYPEPSNNDEEILIEILNELRAIRARLEEKDA